MLEGLYGVAEREDFGVQENREYQAAKRAAELEADLEDLRELELSDEFKMSDEEEDLEDEDEDEDEDDEVNEDEEDDEVNEDDDTDEA